MALDPARFVVADCNKGRAVQTQNTLTNNAFLRAIIPSSVLGSLNVAGYSPISTGLSTLAQVSTAFRVGQTTSQGQLNTELYASTYAAMSAINSSQTAQGGNAVLNAVGISPQTVTALGQVNPAAAGAAAVQAQTIFSQVKAGTFTVSNLSEAFGPLQTAANIASQIFTGSPLSSNTQITHCQASPYAVDLVARAPRNKFMFIVQFLFNPPYGSLFDSYGRGTAFVVKQSTRPQVEFEYDDVNMYNFRTKVPKRTIYAPMSMTFYDDNTNNVTNFHNAYLKAHSPIANIGGSISAGGAVSMDSPTPDLYALDSMNNSLSSASSASFGPLQNNQVTLLQSVRLFHIYNYGNAMTVYNMYNPKITRLSPDELSMMESGNGSEMQFEFSYDGLFIVPEYDLVNTSPFDIQQLTSGGLYPIIPTFTSATPINSSNGATGNSPSSGLSLSAVQAIANTAQAKLSAAQSSGANPTVIAAAAADAAQAQQQVSAAAAQAAQNLPRV